MSRFAFLFPGQGSQYPSMGHALYGAEPASRQVFDAADQALEFGISNLCFEGTDAQLALTENTQPAILTTSLAALRALESRGLRPCAAAGHSLGEYAALVAAGTLDAMDAVRTVRLRGRFMQEAVPAGEGAMAAILGLDAAAVARVCEAASEGQVVAPANLNTPKQTVIAGTAAAVARAGEAALRAGARRVFPLAVSAPFHCALMQPAAERLRPVLERVQFKDPAFPVYSNVDARPVSGATDARAALLRQVAAPVRWCELIEAMVADGIDTFVEVGPGRVLAGLVRGIRRDARVLPAGDPATVEAAAAALTGGLRQ